MSLQYPARDNVDLQGESLENPRNVVILWESPVGTADVTPSDNDYTTEGLLVYTDNADLYRLWRRNSVAFGDPTTDSAISPDTPQGASFWAEIATGGAGRDFQVSDIAPTTRSDGGALESGDEWLDSSDASDPQTHLSLIHI